MRGDVNNLRPVASQQDAFLPPSFLYLKQFAGSDLPAFSVDLEAFGWTPLFFCHSRRAWRNAAHVNMISGKCIRLSLWSIMELYNPSAHLLQLFAWWHNLMWIILGNASTWKWSGHWPFVSSFRLSLHCIWTTHTTFHTLRCKENDTNWLPEGNEWIPNTPPQIQRGWDHNALLYCPFLIENTWF